MNRNGVLASMCFPTFTGFSRAAPQHAPRGRHAGHGVGLQRLAHRRVGGQLPGPLHPDRDRCRRGTPRRCAPRSAASPPRAAAPSPCRNCRTSKGCRATTTTSTGARCSGRCREENVVMCLHIGTGFGAISMAPERADRQPDHPGHPGVGDVRAGPAVGSGDAQLPRPEGRVLRGRHRLDPVLPRPQRPALHEPEVAAPRLRRQAAERGVPRALAGLLRHRQDVAEAAPRDRHRHHRLGVRLPALRLHLARRPRAGAGRARTPRAPTTPRSTRSPGRTPAGSSAGTRSRARPREQATVAALRAKATDVDVSIRPRKEWARLYEQKQLAKT